MSKINLLKIVVGITFVLALFWLTPTVADCKQPTIEAASPPVEIVINARQFQPAQVTVPLNRKATLIFLNQDAELHAFVPQAFLENVSAQVSGNGAPQFNEKGLVRILIPSGGRTEIRFVPKSSGLYQYRCDLPGHEMLGKILVKDHLGQADSALNQDDIVQAQP